MEVDIIPDEIRWGFLSCARVARNRWIPALRTARGGRAAAIASRSEDKARQWADELEIPAAYGDYNRMLEASDIDAVFIGLPNSMHHEWVIKALTAGKHVLCDKPLALNAGQARDMVRAAEKNKKLLLEGFMYRFHPQYERVRRWLAEDLIGPLRMLRISFGFHFDRPDDFRYDPHLGGGVLLDLGCYCVHLARMLIGGEPVQVTAQTVTYETGADWSATVILRFSPENPILAMIDCSFTAQSGQFFHLIGENGMMQSNRPYNPREDVTLTLTTADKTVTETVPACYTYIGCLEDIHRRIKSGNILPCPARDSIANHQVLDAIALSVREQRTIHF